MRIFKKLDIFILKDYLLLFAGTFFICLFIFMMQFMWRYLEELVGRGLSMDVLMKFFYYSGLTLVPMSRSCWQALSLSAIWASAWSSWP